jgi:GTPase-activating protein
MFIVNVEDIEEDLYDLCLSFSNYFQFCIQIFVVFVVFTFHKVQYGHIKNLTAIQPLEAILFLRVKILWPVMWCFQIHIDIPRMSPLIALFQQKTVQEMFERILFIWAIRHPASGYVQGINDLVTPFFVVFLQEVIPAGLYCHSAIISYIHFCLQLYKFLFVQNHEDLLKYLYNC